MFSFLKSKSPDASATTDTTADAAATPDTAEDVTTPATPDPVEENPLAAMVWDAPDVPQPAVEPSTSSHGLDVGALVAPPPSASKGPGFGPPDQARTDAIKPGVVAAISTIYDPEIPVNIYELGLIYDIVSDAEGRVTVTMTLTSPACPSAQQLPAEAHFKTKASEGVTDAYVDVVWDPPWSKDMMSETARMALGMF